MTPPNTQFVELHPEAALRLAWTLRLQDVARAALSVLAAERAIKRLGTLRHHIYQGITPLYQQIWVFLSSSDGCRSGIPRFLSLLLRIAFLNSIVSMYVESQK